MPEPAGGNGFTIERDYYTPDGEPTDIATIGQNERFVVVLTVTADQATTATSSSSTRSRPATRSRTRTSRRAASHQLRLADVERNAAHTEARVDRFVAALDRGDDDPLEFSVAYSMRAVSPGTSPSRRRRSRTCIARGNARTDTGTVEVVGPTR